jgi:hypothetical protein
MISYFSSLHPFFSNKPIICTKTSSRSNPNRIYTRRSNSHSSKLPREVSFSPLSPATKASARHKPIRHSSNKLAARKLDTGSWTNLLWENHSRRLDHFWESLSRCVCEGRHLARPWRLEWKVIVGFFWWFSIKRKYSRLVVQGLDCG